MSGILRLKHTQPGCSYHSFGVEVAQLAGLPGSVIQRAQVCLVTTHLSVGGLILAMI